MKQVLESLRKICYNRMRHLCCESEIPSANVKPTSRWGTRLSRLPVILVVVLVGLVVTLVNCGDDENPTDSAAGQQNGESDTATQYGDSILSLSPIAIDSITSFAPLGNLNPPGHTFPTDHCYLYLPAAPGANAPFVISLYSPGRLRIENVSAFQHVNAGITDYSIDFALKDSIQMRFGHVSSLTQGVFGDTSFPGDWNFVNEYTTGGETYRMWTKSLDTIVDAGVRLGTVGGNPGQGALDIGVYDWRRTNGIPANPQIWSGSGQNHAFCPLSYYESGPVRDSLHETINRVSVPGDAQPCGWVVQDVSGTAQGAWLKPNEPAPYPEDPHLALVWHSTDPRKQAFSVGVSVPSIGQGLILFDPAETGRLNRRFDQVTSDGLVYGYTVASPGNGSQMTIIIQMTDAATLEIEGLAGHLTDSLQWLFTSDKVVFRR